MWLEYKVHNSKQLFVVPANVERKTDISWSLPNPDSMNQVANSLFQQQTTPLKYGN